MLEIRGRKNMSYSIGYDEGYKCTLCDKMYDFDDVYSSGWKCPVCGEYVFIAAPQLCSGHVKIRKKAKEVRKMESINLAGSNDFYEVLGITKLANGKLGIGLKGFGSIKVKKDEFVDVIVGAYCKENWDKSKNI